MRLGYPRLGLGRPGLVHPLAALRTWGRGKPAPHPPINSGAPRGGETHNRKREILWGALVSSPCASLPLSLVFLPCGSPKGCVGARTTPLLHMSCYGNSRSDPNRSTSAILSRSEIRRSSSITICVQGFGGSTFAAPSHCTGVVASWSTRPWGRLRQHHHQRLCGSVIPAFGLQGYVTEYLVNRYNITNI
jgi:hypothetical protein